MLMSHLQRSFFALAVSSLLMVANANAVEEAEYTVVVKEGDFELRQYAPHILAETIVAGEFEDAGGEAFGRLFKYISGDNKSQQKVAMTSPVGQVSSGEKIDMTSPVGQEKAGEDWAVSFMMPASFTLETLPEPVDPNVFIRAVPARHIAAVRYSGGWNEEKYLKNKARLEGWVKKMSFKMDGDVIWARYDPPFMPWFFRRNEVLMPVVKPAD